MPIMTRYVPCRILAPAMQSLPVAVRNFGFLQNFEDEAAAVTHKPVYNRIDLPAFPSSTNNGIITIDCIADLCAQQLAARCRSYSAIAPLPQEKDQVSATVPVAVQ